MEPQPDESDPQATQTTLTTRIRINIPGSRPIPPVVMRTPVNDGEASDGAAASAGAGAGPDRTAAGASGSAASEGGAGDSGQAEEKTSDWFAPRKSAGPAGPGAGPAAGSGPAAGPGAGAGVAGGSGPGAGPGPGTRGGGAPGSGTPGGGPGAAEPQRGDLPFFSGNGSAPAAAPSANGRPGPLGNTPAGPPGSLAGPGAGIGAGPGAGPGAGAPKPGGPSGPTTGPATGEGPLLPPGFSQGGGAPLGGPGPRPEPPRMSDDTAVLTPQSPAGEPPAPGGHVSGSTLTSGIPVVPPASNSPFGPQATPHTPHTPPVLPDPPAPRPQQGGEGGEPPTTTSSRPKKKGRNKLVLAASAVIGLTGVAYGAGLLMNHSDVPKGTSVLGVDIGGGTRDEAVKKLNSALDKRAKEPLKLSIDGEDATLEPEQSGLSLDGQATVREAAGSDYNPVSVIGSLFGQQREIDPVLLTDDEKLRDSLERVAGAAGSSGEGTIEFKPGKAVAVYGTAGKALNPEGSITAIEEAYRTKLETGEDTAVQLPVTSAEPKITKAEVDRMMKEFATPAMSGLITVQTDATHTVSFSPEKSIYKFVSVKASDSGKLVPYYDRVALKELYGGAFVGVMVTKGDGSKKPLSVEEVALAVDKALRGKTPAERIVTIPTNPS